jgi:hypothetical protein
MSTLAEQLHLSFIGLEKMAQRRSLTPVHVASVVRSALEAISHMTFETDEFERSTSFTMLRRIIERFHQSDHDTSAVLRAVSDLNPAQSRDVRAIVVALGYDIRDCGISCIRSHTALRYAEAG